MLLVPVDAKGRKTVELTDEQASQLALGPELELLGCGQMACAYAANDGRVVKFTKDTRDALASFILSNFPAAGKGWAIPIHAVYRLEGSKRSVIIASRAEPIDDDAVTDAIDYVFDEASRYSDSDLIVPETWRAFVERTYFASKALSNSTEREARLEALDAVNRAVQGFHRLGLDWLDFHSGNFAYWRGKLVAIDLGLSFPTETVPAETLDRAGVEYL